MLRGSALFQTLAACLVSAGVACLQYIGWKPLLEAEIAAVDALARHGRKAPIRSDLVFLSIDNRSAQLDATIDLGINDMRDADPASVRALQLMSASWPWSREVHGLVLDRLIQAGARAVVFDLLFTGETENDAPFRRSLDRYSDRVVVAANLVPDRSHLPARHFTAYAPPAASLVSGTHPGEDRVGFDNFVLDRDDVVRSARYRVVHGREYLSLAARAAEKAGRRELIPEGSEPRRFRFTGPAGSFPPRSIYEIFVPKLWRSDYENGAFFRDKVVMIGASGNWQRDVQTTPHREMPGAELHLNALNALLTGSLINEPSKIMRGMIVALAGLLAWLLWRLIRTPVPRFFALILLNACLVYLAIFLWNRADFLIPPVAPLVVLNICCAAGLLADSAAERREKSRVRRALERYVSRNVAREMMDNPAQLRAALGGVVKPATILFSDIRNFTQVSAQTEPHAMVGQLNEYLSTMVDCVFRHGGTLDKFIGNAIIAVWGNARSDGAVNDALQATRCALVMQEELRTLNARWARQGREQLEFGIALNHGDVLVGNIGSPQRMDFTVIGDAVNGSWKLQERTKLHRCELLLGKKVADLIAHEFPTEEVGALHITEGVATRYSRLTLRVGTSTTNAVDTDFEEDEVLAIPA